MTKVIINSESANDSLQISASANEKGIVNVFSYNGNNVSFKNKDGHIYINMTEVAKSFPSKNLTQIVNSQEIKEYCESLSKLQNYSLEDLLIVIRGGNSNGTWAHQKLALRIAQKLSPDFSVWVDTKIEELLLQGKTELVANDAAKTKSEEVVSATFIGIDFIAKSFRLNDTSKALMFNRASKDFAEKGLAYIPSIDYVDYKGQLLSATELLKRNNVNLSARVFNAAMIDKGLIDRKSRPSKKGVKYFNNLTDKASDYGENQVSPNNPKETQPLYYEHKFLELLSVIGLR